MVQILRSRQTCVKFALIMTQHRPKALKQRPGLLVHRPGLCLLLRYLGIEVESCYFNLRNFSALVDICF